MKHVLQGVDYLCIETSFSLIVSAHGCAQFDVVVLTVVGRHWTMEVLKKITSVSWKCWYVLLTHKMNFASELRRTQF